MPTKSKSILIIIVIAIAAGLIYWGVASVTQPKATNELIKIGVLESITGPSAGWGSQANEGALLAEEQINSDSVKIKIITEDSKNDPKEALAAFKRMTEAGALNGLISMGSGVMLALAPNIDEPKIITINGGAVSDKLSGVSKYEFNMVPLAKQDSAYIIDQMVNTFNQKKIAILVSNDDFGMSSGEMAKQVAEAKNAQVVAFEKYLVADTDFKTQIMKIKHSQPDALFIVGSASGLVLKQATELNFSLPVFSNAPFENPDIIKQGGKAVVGVIYTGLKLPENNQIDEFNKKYEEKFGHKPSIYSYTTYDAVTILAKYFTECKKDKECVIDKLRNEEFSGLYNGKIKFNDQGELVSPDFYLKTVKDGQFVNYQ